MLLRWLVLSALVFAGLMSERAVAQNATGAAHVAEALRVEPSTDRCLSEAVVRARVLKRLARDAILSDVQVIVRVADAPRLEVLRGGRVIAQRRFESFPAACNARRDAIAVAVALAIERAREEAVVATSTDATSASVEATSVAVAPPAVPTGPRSDAAELKPTKSSPAPQDAHDGGAPSLGIGVHAGIAAIVEILPAPAWAGVLGADVALGDIRVSLSALASLEQRDDVLGAAIDSRLLLGRALACGDLTSLGDVAVEGCAGALAGAAFASGFGYDSNRSTELAYVAAIARAALRFPASGTLSARLAIDGLVPALRPSYVLREGESGETTELTAAPIGAALSVEIALTLP